MSDGFIIAASRGMYLHGPRQPRPAQMTRMCRSFRAGYTPPGGETLPFPPRTFSCHRRIASIRKSHRFEARLPRLTDGIETP